MNPTPRILIVDRDAIVGRSLRDTLEGEGYDALHVPTGSEAIEAMEHGRADRDAAAFGVALIDQDAVGPTGGIHLARRLHRDRPTLVPIMLSGFRKVEAAVEAMRLGAADYLLKPIAEAELRDAVQRAMQRHLLLIERDTAQQDIPDPRREAVHDTGDANPTDDGQDVWQPVALSEAMKAPERRILLQALEANEWNRGQTARDLEINRTTLYKKIRQYRLDEPA
ncbi:MAG: response regulator [Phycisphaeraceae bacterium]